MTHTCGRRHGFLGRVVAPLIERRRQLKQQIVVKGDAADRQQNALKWLVTCFGYTGYRNARFGRIEAHEAICAWARELLLQTIDCAQERGWEVLHAIVDSIWIRDREGRSLEEQHQSAMDLSNHVHKMTGIPLEYEATYRCIAFLPSRMHSGGSLTKYWAYGEEEWRFEGLSCGSIRRVLGLLNCKHEHWKCWRMPMTWSMTFQVIVCSAKFNGFSSTKCSVLNTTGYVQRIC